MNRIKELRISKNMKQEDLEKILNVKRSVISKYENGSVPITSDTIDILTKFFGVSADYLLGQDENPRSLPWDDETLDLMQQAKDELNVLFSMDPKATKEDLQKAIEIIKVLKAHDEDSGDY